MKFTIVTLVLAAVSAALAAPGGTNYLNATASYDTTYDNPDGSLWNVACSNGQNGLITKGFTTFGSLPSFPKIGGASVVTGWNSANCGSCWTLQYQGNSINVMAVDYAGQYNGAPAFNIALRALNALTKGRGVELGRVSVTAFETHPSNCICARNNTL